MLQNLHIVVSQVISQTFYVFDLNLLQLWWKLQ